MRFESKLLHSNQPLESHGARANSITPTAAYLYPSTAQANSTFSGETPGYVYSRGHNPTNSVFEARICDLEGGKAAISVNSGLAAQFTALSALVVPGDNIISSGFLFGGSLLQLRDNFRGFGVETRFVTSLEIEDYEKLIDDRTRCIIIDSISNPAYLVADIKKFSDLCKKYQIPLVVDNTLGCGGYLIRPIDHGADIVIHSATKWIGGHGTTLAGVFIDAGSFKWSEATKFTKLCDPQFGSKGKSYVELHGDNAYVKHCRSSGIMLQSATLNPFGAWLLLQGLETLSVRVDRECENAVKLATYLKNSPFVKWVSYLGFEDHETHELSKKYLNGPYFGSCISFAIKDESGADIVESNSAKVIDNLKIISNTVNLGDAKTLICIPHISTNRGTQGEYNESVGIDSDLIRISVGIEHIDDLIGDLEQAFKTVFA
ncbi:homocysteine/cysteine synthase [[Candida] jaroonii]|uniref:Homocysteine/cysteine synthase n=1 Tax=[Candida] jaroonii TaxID=467808 RepID=A0ACA9YCK5_9ASCO|nr:homocysteine/cysteine synthase [[Candida] jaroonii]